MHTIGIFLLCKVHRNFTLDNLRKNPVSYNASIYILKASENIIALMRVHESANVSAKGGRKRYDVWECH